jgi:3' exoribonuclease, RNase T-like
MNDYSIDLETLGKRYDAPIVSIGVQQFNRDTGKLGQTFYRVVDINSSIKAGRIDGSTVAWWIEQSTKAKVIFAKDTPKVGLATALDELARWMRGFPGDPRVWGNGATFDISILEYAFDHGGVGLKEPWQFFNVRDVRTLVDAAGYTAKNVPVAPVGTHHNALDDAIYQANVVSHCWQRIGAALYGQEKAERIAQSAAVAVDDDL